MRIVGIDGGATSTKGLVVNEKGHVLGWGQGGPANHLSGEEDVHQLRNALKQVFTAAFPNEKHPRVDSVCFGKTGFQEKQRELVISIIREFLDAEYLCITGDMPIALAGASLGRPGILVYAGTGANTYGVGETGEEVWVGGWGYLVDDEGAGYDIGRQALKRAFRALDGRNAPTLLQEKLKQHFGCVSMAAVLEKVYQNGGLSRPEVAVLSNLVYEAAEEGDSVAQEILAQAGRTLAKTAIVALRKLGKQNQRFTVYPAGGVFRAGRWILEPFTEALHQDAPFAEVRSPQFPPVVGAILLALRPVGIAIDRSFLDNLRRSLEEIEWTG